MNNAEVCGEIDMEKDEYSIRSIKRGLSVLQAINRSGSLRLKDISLATDLPYPTICRIVETLVEAGMIEREESVRKYRPTALVQTLSLGYQEDHALAMRARSHIVTLCKKVNWPITIATRVGNTMMIRDSTHRLTTLTFNNYGPGYTLPLLECSVGKAYVAYCDDEERDHIISSLGKLDTDEDRRAYSILIDGFLVKRIISDGYATHEYNQYTESPGKTSSLGVPIFVDGKLAGGLGLIFFSSSMSAKDAARDFVHEMKLTADAIGGQAGLTQNTKQGSAPQ
jgi:IclR family transcriptional regulator, mhp operon transcriptional activator